MIKELQSKYMADNVDKWLNNRDRFMHLLSFEDCIYDFNTRPSGFRENNLEDMVTMSFGYTMSQVLEYTILVQNIIIAALKDIHDPEVFEYIMKILATSVHGDRRNDKFQIWTGTGANGKGLTRPFLTRSLANIFTSPGKLSSRAALREDNALAPSWRS